MANIVRAIAWVGSYAASACSGMKIAESFDGEDDFIEKMFQASLLANAAGLLCLASGYGQENGQTAAKIEYLVRTGAIGTLLTGICNYVGKNRTETPRTFLGSVQAALGASMTGLSLALSPKVVALAGKVYTASTLATMLGINVAHDLRKRKENELTIPKLLISLMMFGSMAIDIDVYKNGRYA